MTQLELFPEDISTNNNNLPASWTWVSLDEISEVNPRMTWEDAYTDDMTVSFVPMASVDDISGTILKPQIKSIQEVWQGYKRFAEGDVIFARITPCMENGKAAIATKLVNGLGFGSTEFHVLRPSDTVLAAWIYHFIRQQNFRDDAAHHMTGTAGQLRVPAEFMREARIPLAPLNEQRRIVEAIETFFTRLDAGVEALKRLQKNLERYKASVLKVACEGSLVPQNPDDEPASELLKRILQERRAKWEAEELVRYKAKGQIPPKGWQNKYQEPTPPDTDGLPELPEGWVWTSFEELLYILKNGYFGGKPQIEPIGIPILRIGAVRPMSIDLKNRGYFHDIEPKMADYVLKDDDLLFVRYNGNVEYVGACGVIRGLSEDLIYPDKLIRATLVNKELTLPHYLEIYFATSVPRRIIESEAVSTAGQNGISGEKIKALPVALPPLETQRGIVDEVDRLLSLSEGVSIAITENIKRAERLRQAILKEAFSGRLVPQDPSDEPATELLRRIKAERKKR